MALSKKGEEINDLYGSFDHCKTMVFTIDLYDYLKTKTERNSLFTTIELCLADSHGELVRFTVSSYLLGILPKRFRLSQSASQPNLCIIFKRH